MKIKANCSYCGKEFEGEKKYINHRIKRNKGGKIFCSHECASKDKQNGKILNCSECGKIIYRTKTDIINTKSGKNFCGRVCHNLNLGRSQRGKDHPNYRVGAGSYSVLALREQKVRKCDNCGRKTWLGKPISLEVHHKDMDHDNNDINNLLVCCPNCHNTFHKKGFTDLK